MRSISRGQKIRIRERDNWTCVYCKRKRTHENYLSLTLEVDHVVPIKHGGIHGDSNMVTCCAECNRGRLGKFASIKWSPIHGPNAGRVFDCLTGKWEDGELLFPEFSNVYTKWKHRLWK